MSDMLRFDEKEWPYEAMLYKILSMGHPREDRTGVGTIGLFGCQMRFDLNRGFPLITTKRVHFKSVAYELLWFLRGDTNIKWLNDNGVTIWDEWANEYGELGPVYGEQWRSFGGEVDQIAAAVKTLQTNPYSRRNLVTAWDPMTLNMTKLPPCHVMFQFYVSDNKLSCHLYQRSADFFLGVPFNIASYALLTHMMAEQAGLGVGEFIWTGGDCHIYSNHIEQVKLQLSREPRPYPTLELDQDIDIDNYGYDDIHLIGYDPHPGIRAEVAV